MNGVTAWRRIRIWFSNPLAWVLIGGFSVRLYSAVMRTIINPDGAQYIYQASAIYNQNWSGLLDCKLSYLSPLPIFIAAAFTVCRDWIVAGQLVNLLFGWATLLPLYYILRRFFDRNVCTLTVLIYALMPVFVEGSANVARGPMFWFFLSSGMLFFMRQWDEDAKAGRFRYDLLTSVFLFLLATWCRIEGVVFMAAPFAYLCVTRTDRKLQRCCIFLMPLAIIGLAAVGVALVTGADLYTTLRFKQVIREATQFALRYQALDAWIRNMQTQYDGQYEMFLIRARETLGLIPLVVIFHHILEGVFYPFALIFFMGFFRIRQKYHQNRRIACFLWQTFAGLLVLYIHMLQVWVMSYRFLAVLIFPGCVIMANGVETMVRYFQNKRQWPSAKAIGWVAVALIILGLPKSLKPEESDKSVYRQAARIMVQQAVDDQPVNIAGFKRTRALEWILLYSHRNTARIHCSLGLGSEVVPDYRRFLAKLDRAGIRFVLYEERYWPHDILDLPSAPYQKDFRLLGQWQHPDSKMFMLLERLET